LAIEDSRTLAKGLEALARGIGIQKRLRS
jgi:hypothetical protein